MKIKHNILSIVFILTLVFNNYAQKNHLLKFSVNVVSKNLSFGDYIPATISCNNALNQKFKIKYRGNSSAGYDKKSYSIKFNKKQAFYKLDSAYKWKLNAEYIDKTLMRNKLSYDLFRAFSENNISPKIEYALLNVNDTNKGIYALTQRVDASLLQLDKTDTNAIIFKAPPISNPTDSHSRKHKGFISYSNWNPFYKKFSDRAKEKLIKQTYYNQRYPNINEYDKKQEIHTLTNFLFYSSDNEFSTPEIFNSFFDLESLIDWHLLLLITNNGDGLVKNFYLYKQNANTPYKICPWDYDHSFGRDGNGEPDKEIFINVSKIKVLDRLMKTNAFNYKEKLLSKYCYLKKEKILTYKAIRKMVKNNVRQLKPYIHQNENIWPPNAIPYFEDSNFKTEVALLNLWVKKRLPKVEAYLLAINTKASE